MVKNPNSVLQNAIAGQDIKSTTVLAISTKHTPIKGGGTANTAFLEAASSPPGGNAQAVAGRRHLLDRDRRRRQRRA